MEFTEQHAIYLQIADYLCEQILIGTWTEGDRVPSVREMAVSLEVNPNTVARTYAYLQEKGVIAIQRGVGYFVADGGYPSTQALKRDDFIKKDLPRVFKTMDLLQIDFGELRTYYDRHAQN